MIPRKQSCLKLSLTFGKTALNDFNYLLPSNNYPVAMLCCPFCHTVLNYDTVPSYTQISCSSSCKSCFYNLKFFSNSSEKYANEAKYVFYSVGLHRTDYLNNRVPQLVGCYNETIDLQTEINKLLVQAQLKDPQK